MRSFLNGAPRIAGRSTALFSAAPSFGRKRSLLARRDRPRASAAECAARAVEQRHAPQSHRTGIMAFLIVKPEESLRILSFDSITRQLDLVLDHGMIGAEHGIVY